MPRMDSTFRLLLALASASVASLAPADVIVLSNRSGIEVPLRFTPVRGQAQQITLGKDDNLPLYVDGKANISFSTLAGSQNFGLDANCAYFIGRTAEGHVGLQQIGLGEDGTLTSGHDLPGAASRAGMATVTVKIYVDEEEPGRQIVWEQRLRR